MDDLDSELAGYGPPFLERLNDDFEDSLLLVGRVLGGCREATAVIARGVDRHGIDARLTTPRGAATCASTSPNRSPRSPTSRPRPSSW